MVNGDNGDSSIERIQEGMKGAQYLCDEGIATALLLADELGKPILTEGPAGVGKTDLAKVYSRFSGLPLIRLQCYEGLDEARALYEWNYKKQLLYIQADSGRVSWDELEEDLFGEDFLLPRPLLKAITSEGRVVLLIDEVADCFNRCDVDEAVERVFRERVTVDGDGHSDIGRSLDMFRREHADYLSPRSTVMILSDARNNARDRSLKHSQISHPTCFS